MDKTYSELLRDPRWQKMRLEVMQRDHFRCRCCESPSKTLNVHHQYYIKGNDPWEYEVHSLITLCENCHANVKIYDWQRAFLDLNLTPKQLLEFALQMKFYLKKNKDEWDAAKQAGEVKYNYNPSWHYSDGWVDVLKEGELDEYYRDFQNQEREKYLKN